MCFFGNYFFQEIVKGNILLQGWLFFCLVGFESRFFQVCGFLGCILWFFRKYSGWVDGRIQEVRLSYIIVLEIGNEGKGLILR